MKAFALLMLVSFSAMADCYTEARMVMSNLEADQICSEARPGFDRCFPLATMTMSSLSAVSFCAKAESGIADCHDFASVSLGYRKALELCQTAPRFVRRCLDNRPFGTSTEDAVIFCTR